MSTRPFRGKKTGRRGWRIIACLFGLGGLLTLAAIAESPSTPTTDELLARVYAMSREQGALTMPFTHRRYSTLFKQPQTRSGLFYFDGNDHAAMFYKVPETYVFLICGDEAFHLRPNDPAPQPLDLRRAPLLSGMTRMFQMDPDKLKAFFAVTAKTSDDEKEIQVELTPLRKAPVARVMLHVDASTGLLRQMRLDETGGDSQVIQFGDPEPVPPNADSFRPEYWIETLKDSTP